MEGGYGLEIKAHCSLIREETTLGQLRFRDLLVTVLNQIASDKSEQYVGNSQTMVHWGCVVMA